MGAEAFPCVEGQDSKIIQVDIATGDIVWGFDEVGGELGGAHNADLNTAEDQMIISDSCNDRVLVISYPGDPEPVILWDSSVDCPELDLTYPNDANFMGDGIDDHLLITVRDDHWAMEVDPALCNGVRDGEIVWSLGVEGVPRDLHDFDDPTHLRGPHNADLLPNGNIIISDSGNEITGPSRIIEVDPDHPGEPNKIVWSYKKKNDCTVKGTPDLACPGINWARDADVECDDLECNTGIVFVTGIHQTVGVERDLTEPPPDGEDHPRGRTVHHQVQHGVGFCYDSDGIPQWDGETNGGLGFFLVSNHGPFFFGNWLRVVPVDAADSNTESIWQLNGLQAP
jgi:hypothetical protein